MHLLQRNGTTTRGQQGSPSQLGPKRKREEYDSSSEISKKKKLGNKKLEKYGNQFFPFENSIEIAQELFGQNYSLLSPKTGKEYCLVSEINANSSQTRMMFKAIEKKTGNIVALKIYNTYGLPEERDREIRALTALKGEHHVIRLLEFFTIPGVRSKQSEFRVLVFPFIESNLPKNYSEFWIFLEQALEAISFCHSKGIIHGDIKPSNLLFQGSDQKLFLIDFGEACFEEEEFTPSGREIGTAKYRPYEAIKNGTISPMTDLWQIGLVVAHVVYGSYPFEEILPLLQQCCDRHCDQVLVDSILQAMDRQIENCQSEDFANLCQFHSSSFHCQAGNVEDCKKARQLLKNLLTPSPEIRFTADQALTQMKSLVCIRK